MHIELVDRQLEPLPSESAIYRAVVQPSQIAPERQRARAEHWRRWERDRPNELWQMDTGLPDLLAR